MRECLRNIRIGRSAAKSRIGICSTTNRDECNGVGLQAIGNSKS